MPASAGISVPPPALRTKVGLTLRLQPSEVTQDGAEGRSLGWLIGQALAGKHGQLQARRFRQLVLLLVEMLFLWGREPEGVSDSSPSQVPFPKRQGQTPRAVRLDWPGPCSVIPTLQMKQLSLGKEKPTCLPPEPGLESKSSRVLCGASHTWPFLSWLPAPLLPGSSADAAP